MNERNEILEDLKRRGITDADEVVRLFFEKCNPQRFLSLCDYYENNGISSTQSIADHVSENIRNPINSIEDKEEFIRRIFQIDETCEYFTNNYWN